jgi:NADH:ubiquinone oxidoreductase subunit E
MSFDNLSSDDKQKLNSFMDAGMKVLQEVADLKEGLRDTAKNLAEEFETKPGVLMKALSAAFKANIEEQKEGLEAVETILQVTGRA